MAHWGEQAVPCEVSRVAGGFECRTLLPIAGVPPGARFMMVGTESGPAGVIEEAFMPTGTNEFGLLVRLPLVLRPMPGASS